MNDQNIDKLRERIRRLTKKKLVLIEQIDEEYNDDISEDLYDELEFLDEKIEDLKYELVNVYYENNEEENPQIINSKRLSRYITKRNELEHEMAFEIDKDFKQDLNEELEFINNKIEEVESEDKPTSFFSFFKSLRIK